MEIKDLEARIEKKIADIEKTERSINKFITKNNFSTEDIEYAKENGWKEVRRYAEANFPLRDDSGNYIEANYWKQVDFEDLKRRYGTLSEQNAQLQKYQNQLTMMKAREEGRASTKRVPVIVEFLENWKNDVIKFIERDVDKVEKYYEIDHEMTELFNSRFYLIRSGEMTEDEWHQKYDEAKKRRNQYKSMISSLTWTVYDRSSDSHVNYTELNKILDKEVENKYWSMVNKVTDITGEIVDARGLRIAGDGNLNGIIIGKDGKAKLETILAGGYNQGIIVNVKHGQILHFRVLVHEVK